MANIYRALAGVNELGAVKPAAASCPVVSSAVATTTQDKDNNAMASFIVQTNNETGRKQQAHLICPHGAAHGRLLFSLHLPAIKAIHAHAPRPQPIHSRKTVVHAGLPRKDKYTTRPTHVNTARVLVTKTLVDSHCSLVYSLHSYLFTK